MEELHHLQAHSMGPKLAVGLRPDLFIDLVQGENLNKFLPDPI